MFEDHLRTLHQPAPRASAGDALLLVDVQRDLFAGGALAVPGAEEALGPANACLDLFVALGLPVFASRDWHPQQHCSFSARGGHLPAHCVAGTEGARFAAGLRLPSYARVLPKGVTADRDAFSAFADSDLDLQLSALCVRRLFIAGLSPDFGVLYDVADALGWGYHVVLVSDAVVTVDRHPGEGARALAALQHSGVVVVRSAEIAGIEHGHRAACAETAEMQRGVVSVAVQAQGRQGGARRDLRWRTAESAPAHRLRPQCARMLHAGRAGGRWRFPPPLAASGASMNPVHTAATHRAPAVAAVPPQLTFAPLNAGFEAYEVRSSVDHGFLAMRHAFWPSGGLARGDDLARLLEDQGQGDFISLARLIVSRQVFGFDWLRTFWVPMCQFDLRDLSLKAWPAQMLAESADACDGWSLARWLVEPNAWLEHQRPIELLDIDQPAVLAAACADRCITAE